MPRLHATDSPLRIAHSDELPPRWHEITLMSDRPKQLGHSRRDVAVAGAVKPPAPDAEVGRPLVGDRVTLVSLGNRPVKAGFKGRDQRKLGKAAAEHPHGLGVGRIVRRRDVGEGLHRREHRVVHQVNAGEILRRAPP